MIGHWLREKLAPGVSATDAKFQRALAATEEVTEAMREKAASPDPIRALLADMFLQNHDIALVADAYEASQEARIYKGPE